MKARFLQRDRFAFDDGSVVEMVIWSVPTPVAGSTHAYNLADVERWRSA
jgi:hypothetical protein